MKFEEYQKMINNIVSTPEKAPELAQNLLEAIKTDTTLIDSQNVKIGEQDAKIRDLQDTNIKMFLAQTGQKQEINEPAPVTPRSIAEQMFSSKGER